MANQNQVMDKLVNKRNNGNPEKVVIGVRHLQLLMMFLCATVMYVMRSSMGVAILAMTDKSQVNASNAEIYDWGSETSGIILSSFFWGMMPMQVPAGILCKMYGGKLFIFLALLVNGVLSLATPILAKFGGWIAVCIVRALMGFFQSSYMPAVHTLIGQWAPVQERTRYGALAYAGVQIGTIITLPICGVLSSTSLGWRLIFYCMGILGLLTAILWWFLTASSPAQHPFISQKEVQYIEGSLDTKKDNKFTIPWKSILTSIPLYAIMCAHIGSNWIFIIFFVATPMYLKFALGIDLASSSALSALPYIAQWIISLVCSYLSDYLYNKQYITLTQSRKLFNTFGSVLGFISIISLSFVKADNKIAAIALLTFTNGIIGANNCGYLLNHIDLSPQYAGIMLGMTNCAAHLIGLMGPLSTGYILGDDPTDLTRWRTIFWIAGTILLAANVVYVCFATSERQPWDDPNFNKDYLEGVLEKNSFGVNTKESRPLKGNLYKFQEKS